MTVTAQDIEPVTLLASRVRREERWIMDAFEARGVPYRRLDPRALHVQHDHEGVFAPGIYLSRDIAMFRSSMLAHTLQGAGREVINSADAIDTCSNKWSTALALRAHRIPTPQTWLALSTDAARELIASVGYPVVLKPHISSWGRRVCLVNDPFAADAILEHCDALPSPQAKIPLVQEYVHSDGRDIRALVIGGEVVAAMYRKGEDWRNNVARGALTSQCAVSDDLAGIAIAAARAVGADIAGVDLLERAPGDYVVLEVNAGVEFAGLEAQTGADVAGEIVSFCLTRALAKVS